MNGFEFVFLFWLGFISYIYVVMYAITKVTMWYSRYLEVNPFGTLTSDSKMLRFNKDDSL